MNSREDVEKLIVEHHMFAISLARKLARTKGLTGLEEQDLCSAACLGLCEAAHRFDPENGASFKTFAYLRIHGAMVDLARESNGISRYTFKKLRDAESIDLNHYVSEKPESDSSPKELISFIASVDSFSYEGTKAEHETHVDLVYRDAVSPEQETIKRSTSAFIKDLIKDLEKDQKCMIEGKYFQEKDPHTLADEMGGLSKSVMSRLHTKALDSLRKKMAGRTLECRLVQESHQ